MTNQLPTHQPVLLKETVEGLFIQPDGIYVDATFGRGGHSRAILQQLSANGRLLGLDRDPTAVEAGQALAKMDTRFAIEHCAFSELSTVIHSRLWQGKVNGILMDIGVSSPQLDEAERGFSFQHDGPLDMRMDPTSGMSAAEWLASAEMSEIATVINVLLPPLWKHVNIPLSPQQNSWLIWWIKRVQPAINSNIRRRVLSRPFVFSSIVNWKN